MSVFGAFPALAALRSHCGGQTTLGQVRPSSVSWRRRLYEAGAGAEEEGEEAEAWYQLPLVSQA